MFCCFREPVIKFAIGKIQQREHAPIVKQYVKRLELHTNQTDLLKHGSDPGVNNDNSVKLLATPPSDNRFHF